MAQGYWDQVVAMLKPGDIVIMQFGHNDNAPPHRCTAWVKKPGQQRRYGPHLGLVHAQIHRRRPSQRRHACDMYPDTAQYMGNGKIAHQTDSHADWARTVAKSEAVPLLDLNELIASRYDSLGEEAVTALFADKRVHTSREGAELNAAVVILRSGASRKTRSPLISGPNPLQSGKCKEQ